MDQKINQKTDQILISILIDFWSILIPTWSPPRPPKTPQDPSRHPQGPIWDFIFLIFVVLFAWETNQPIKQSTNQPINQSANQPIQSAEVGLAKGSCMYVYIYIYIYIYVCYGENSLMFCKSQLASLLWNHN